MSLSSPKRKLIPKCKVVVLGPSGSGKTSLINRFMYDQFTREYDTTVGVDYFTRKVTVNDTVVNLQIWDTAGQEKFHSLVPSYIRDTDIALICYDVSQPDSFPEAKKWYSTVIDQRGKDAQCILAGNKVDLEVKVDTKQVEEWCASAHITTIMTSAKTGEAVSELFQRICDLIPTQTPKSSVEVVRKKQISLQEPEPQTNNKGGCC